MRESEENTMKVNNWGTYGVNPYRRDLNKPEGSKNTTGKRTDQVEISQEALNMQKTQTDPLKQAKVTALKEQVKNGTYSIDHQKIATNLYNYYVKKN